MTKLRRTVSIIKRAFNEIDNIELCFTEDDYFVRISRDLEEHKEHGDGKRELTRIVWHLLVKKGETILIDKETEDRKTVIQMLTRVFKALDL